MKGARWLFLLLVVLTITSCLLIAMLAAIVTFVPTTLPDSGYPGTTEITFGLVICMLVPIISAIAGGLVWWLFLRQPKHPAPPVAASAQDSAGLPQETLLNTYLTKMTQLLMTQQQGDSIAGAGIRGLVQAETRQVLQQLNVTHRGRVLQFLHSVGFLSGEQAIALEGIDLSGTDLRFVNLCHANLAAAQLQGAHLTGALLHGANLFNARLDEADLRLARLDQAILTQASLRRSKLNRAVLREARLDGAQLYEANLWGVNLVGARITPEQLQNVESLKDIIT